ncbi:non-hydrolyzing UDP-N-acetylglucosamine 2-epimerase [Lunatibacter salilacus]|uniref:non-hydrolyzing UDP-N-acetylglucosamine 2-epimerase n=1 Tax=Lunatibacter salilacus TaxID=2483804 RepID=UPI00131AB41A|nr:UDP-N-acetylglucosamine 2-epimerase (non-hydrolyzing) [Lunatibacter salilacus]
MLIDLIAGARPNFMKISPIIDAIQGAAAAGKDVRFRLIHTGQHYDKNMSDSFFDQLGIPQPDVNLGAGGGSQAEQTAAIMIGYEKLLFDQGKPALCLVVGDVTSTMACAITAQKLQVKVAHVEAGIRSGDWSMPEEINRLVTDSITNYFFTTSTVANENLRKSGIGEEQIFFVGNTMIDTLIKHRPRFQKPEVWDKIGLRDKEYLVMTLHRPGNVDQEEKLKSLIQEIIDHTQGLPLVFPVHPRTKIMLRTAGISHERLHMIDPLGYLEFNYLVERAKAVITDSGGITEETTVIGVPCMTLRDNTERPETITQGTNELLGTDPKAIAPSMKTLFGGKWKTGQIPEKWDGKTANRIVAKLLEIL